MRHNHKFPTISNLFAIATSGAAWKDVPEPLMVAALGEIIDVVGDATDALQSIATSLAVLSNKS